MRTPGKRKRKKCFAEFLEAQLFLPRPRLFDKHAEMHSEIENDKLQ
jgi:hypothetical protein